MMLYEGDARRCRRCKRRRMDDEPPEVQQYKTCAKCRIIERTKKKLRKPLHEETITYGMRQFQEQSQNSNFTHDDIFSNDQLLNDMQAAQSSGVANPLKQLYNAQYTIYKQPGTGNYPAGGPIGSNYPRGLAFALPGLGPGTPATPLGTLSAAAAAIAAAAINRPDLQLGAQRARLQNHYRQYQQRQGDRSRVSAPTACELCACKLDAEDTTSAMYRLCAQCYLDPYARPNVFSDFNDFLMAVVKNKDANTVTYILELAPYLVESLNSNRSIGLEEQFRKVMLDLFALIYLDPLVALLAPLKFSRTAHNIGDVNNTLPVVSKVSLQYHYTLTPPLRSTYTVTSDSDATLVELMFVTETNLIVIRKSTKKALNEYSVAFLKLLDEQMRAKGLTFADDALKVHAALGLSVGSEQFAKDFGTLQTKIGEVRAGDATAQTPHTNGKEDAAEDAEMDDLDKEQAEENGGEDVGSDEGDEEEDDDEESDEYDAEDPNGLDPAFAP